MLGRYVLGVNVPGGTGLGALEGALGRIAEDGWQAAELNLCSCPVIIGGRVQRPVLEYMGQVMGRFPLRYTAHTAYGLDLCLDGQAGQLHRQVLLCSLEVCAALGIDRLNLHYEGHHTDRRAEERFRDRVRQAADRGGELGVAVNVENIEVEDYRWTLEAVCALDHPNCGMTLDLGHLWLSANAFGYDYIQAVRQCAPRVRHVHVNDNDGVFEPMRLSQPDLYNTLDRSARFVFSRGDIHIPPFWGTAPLGEAFSVLKQAGYDGIWLCEYYSHMFHPLNGDIRRRVEKELAGA